MKCLHKKILLCLFFYMGFIGIACAKLETPSTVYVGVYPTAVYDFNLLNGTFNINFYTWWRTTEKNYKAENSIEIINSPSYTARYGANGQNNNEYFVDARIHATVYKHWDTKHFPFDRQFLTVNLEEFVGKNLVDLKPDFHESHLDPNLVIPGWKIVQFTLKKTMTTYESNFGDSSISKSQYPGLSFTIEIKRLGWRPFVNYFIGFFVTAFLSMIGFFVEEHRDSLRSALCIGSVFAFVGNKYLIDSALPMTSTFSLADAIQLATFLIIVLSILTFIFGNRIFSLFAVSNRKRAEYGLGILLIILYIIFISIYTYFAWAS